MNLQHYRALLADRRVLILLLLGVVIRLPATASLMLTFYVVQSLHESYAAAGVVVTSFTIGAAIGAPWRGRRVDVAGLRPALILPILVETIGYFAASYSSFAPLLAIVFVVGLFSLPSFSVIRQGLAAIVPVEQRRSVLSLDSMGTELTFVIGPALVAWLATAFSPAIGLRAIGLTACAAGCILFTLNPPMRSESPTVEDELSDGRVPSWVTLRLLAVLAVCSGATIVLYGTDVAIFARLRELNQLSSTGIVFAFWGLGSICGALIYGMLAKPPRPATLLLGLAIFTLPLTLAHSVVAMSALVFIAGGLCAPVITATAEAITNDVPERRRGTALGWHGSALTVGGAIAGPTTGAVMDATGPGGGPVFVAAVGVLIATLALGGQALRTRPPSHVND